MNTRTLEALRHYIDCRIEEVLAGALPGEDGYTSSPVVERLATVKAWEDVLLAAGNQSTE